MTPDELEALSIRYRYFARVVPLSSGRWAIFGENTLTISDTLDETLVIAAFEASKKEPPPPPKPNVIDLLKELGL